MYATNARMVFSFRCSSNPDEAEWGRILAYLEGAWASGYGTRDAGRLSLQKSSAISDADVAAALNDYLNSGLGATARADMSLGAAYELKPIDPGYWHIGNGGLHEGSVRLELSNGGSPVAWKFQVRATSGGDIDVWPYVTVNHAPAKVISL